jgi:hypothetical protein
VTMTDDRRTKSVTEAQDRLTRVHEQYAPALRDYLSGFARATPPIWPRRLGWTSDLGKGVPRARGARDFCVHRHTCNGFCQPL